MGTEGKTTKKNKILRGVYSSSMGISMTALTIVAVLEVFMLVYSVVNAPLYREFLWSYRLFYISLLSVALIYIALNLFVLKDIDRRFIILKYANPLYSAFFFAWALGITFFDALNWQSVDAMVFMTFSLTVPLSFFLLPSVYAVIVVIADALMLYMTAYYSVTPGPIINLSIFFVFQIVLGVSFLRLRTKLAERIIEEQENADIDILTGFANRRVYEQDVEKLAHESDKDDLAYLSIDLNGLKDVNDHYGHEAGDRLIIGAAQCMEDCFGEKGKLYRIGGDEFVVLVNINQEELDGLFSRYEKCLQTWSDENDLKLSTANGYAFYSEFEGESMAKLAKAADERMYAAKARYYQMSGMDRRRYSIEEAEPESQGAKA